MLYSIKNREDLERLEELGSLENQVKDLKLHDKLAKQTFHEKIKKVFEQAPDTIKTTSEVLMKTITENFINNNKAFNNLYNNLVEILNVRDILASYCIFHLKLLIVKIRVNLNY